MNTNSKVKAAHVKSETFRMADKEEKAKRRDDAIENEAPRPAEKKFVMAADRLAGDSLYHKNYPIPGMQTIFKTDWKKHYADLFYPNAKLADGTISPVYIDQPVTQFEIQRCKEKMDAMIELGLRYTYIISGHSETEAMEMLDKTTEAATEKKH